MGYLVLYADNTTEADDVAGIEWRLTWPEDVEHFGLYQPRPTYSLSTLQNIGETNEFFSNCEMDSSRNFISWTNSARFRVVNPGDSEIPKSFFPIAIYGFVVRSPRSIGFREICIQNVKVYGTGGGLLESSGTRKTMRLVPDVTGLQERPFVMPLDMNKLPGTDYLVPFITVDTLVRSNRVALETSLDLVNWTGFCTNDILWNGKYAQINLKYYPATNQPMRFFRAIALPP